MNKTPPEVSGLPEDQDEDEDFKIFCDCGASLEMLVGSRKDVDAVAQASGWKIRSLSHRVGSAWCPYCDYKRQWSWHELTETL